MTYPNTKLTRPIRRAIMVGLILSFFIISPIIIFYTAGYGFDFANMRIENTGVLSIDIEPETVTVFINETKNTKKLPLDLPNRAPGVYTIRAEQPGYHPWEHTITISSNQTTYVRNVQLLKQSVPTLFDGIDHDLLTAFFLSGSQRYLVTLSEENDVSHIEAIDIERGQQESLVRVPNAQLASISVSPYDDAMIAISNDSAPSVQMIPLQNAVQIQTYAFQAPVITSTMQWGRAGLIPAVYVESGNTVYRLTQASRETVGTNAGAPWFVDTEGMLYTYDAKTHAIVNTNGEIRTSEIDFDLEKILHVSDTIVIAQGPLGVHVIQTDTKGKTVRKADVRGTHMLHLGTEDTLLVWDDTQLASVTFGGSIRTLTRTSDTIGQATPLDGQDVFALSGDAQIKSLDSISGNEHALISQIEKPEQLLANKKERRLFFLGSFLGKRGLYEMAY